VDDGLQHRLAHVPVSPHGIEQLVLGHELPGIAHEKTEHREGLRGQLERLSVTGQARVALVQHVLTNGEDRQRRRSLIHARTVPKRAGQAYVWMEAPVVDMLDALKKTRSVRGGGV